MEENSPLKRVVTKGEYCCDFETTSLKQYEIEGETRVYLYKIVDLKTGKKEHYGVNIEDFIQYIFTEKDILKVYFHNLSFDGSFIIYHLMTTGWKYVDEIKSPTKQPTFTAIIDNFNSIYELTLSKEERIIKINCSYKLTGLSIKELGKLVGLDKLNETHNYEELKNYKSIEEVSEEELSYITNDVEIMRQAIIKCYQLGIRGMTKSSACYKLWKHIEWSKIKNEVITEYPENIEHIINASYRGGITMVNKKYQGKVLYDMRNYDVNSLYPSVMYRKMPIGEPMLGQTDNDIPKNYELRLYHICIVSAKIIKPYIPFIPTSKSFVWKDSYEYPEELTFLELSLWKEEFELFKLYYDADYKILDIVAWKSKERLFDEYLETFKKIKEEAPNPSPERTFAKGCMNSLYGKFAQTTTRISKRPKLVNGLIEYDNFENECGSGYDRKIASIITSYARCVLIMAINKNPKRFVYCDTDSIYVLGDYDYDIPVDAKKLGYWKYEHSYYKFKALKAKCYISVIKGGEEDGDMHSAISGLPKEVQNTIKFEEFKDGLTMLDVKKQQCRVKGGIVIVKRPFTIKIKKGEIISNEE